MLTREVVELMQRLHDDRDQGQVELSYVGSDLRVLVARVCIVATQQGVNSTDGFFMKEKNPVGDKQIHVIFPISLTLFTPKTEAMQSLNQCMCR